MKNIINKILSKIYFFPLFFSFLPQIFLIFPVFGAHNFLIFLLPFSWV